MKATTIIVIAAGVIVLGLLAWWFMGGDDAPATPLNTPQDGYVTLEGTIVCLPHRDTSGPQTMECAYGLLGENDNYYGLVDADNSLEPNAITSFNIDSAVVVEGEFELGEDIQYATVGTIEVEAIRAR